MGEIKILTPSGMACEWARPLLKVGRTLPPGGGWVGGWVVLWPVGGLVSLVLGNLAQRAYSQPPVLGGVGFRPAALSLAGGHFFLG